MDQEQESSISSRLCVRDIMAEEKDRSEACICCVFSFHSTSAIVGRMKEQKEKLHKRSFALAGWMDAVNVAFYGVDVKEQKAEKEAIENVLEFGLHLGSLST